MRATTSRRHRTYIDSDDEIVDDEAYYAEADTYEDNTRPRTVTASRESTSGQRDRQLKAETRMMLSATVDAISVGLRHRVRDGCRRLPTAWMHSSSLNRCTALRGFLIPPSAYAFTCSRSAEGLGTQRKVRLKLRHPVKQAIMST